MISICDHLCNNPCTRHNKCNADDTCQIHPDSERILGVQQKFDDTNDLRYKVAQYKFLSIVECDEVSNKIPI